jgi:hypothetical protein
MEGDAMPVELMQLDFAGLMQLDERKVARLLLMHLDRVAKDIDDRPHEMEKRKIILELTFSPKKSINNEPTERVNVSIDAKTKTPVYRTSEYDMRITRRPRQNGQTQFGFGFSEAFATNADQNPLPFSEQS